jgi:hypothetical protein
MTLRARLSAKAMAYWLHLRTRVRGVSSAGEPNKRLIDALMVTEFAQHPAGQRMSAWGAVLDPADVQGCGFEASAGPRHVCDLIAIGGRSDGRDFASRPYSDVTGVRRCF